MVLVVACTVTLGGARVLGIEGSFAAGVYTGSLTNTPALAAVLQYQTDTAPAADVDRAVAEPVIGSSAGIAAIGTTGIRSKAVSSPSMP